MSFKILYNQSPKELKSLVFSQWKAKQNPKFHPEGNTLKHIIVVTNRAFAKFPDNKNIQLAAYFHDLGKLATFAINPKTNQPTAYGHEKVSSDLVNKYSEFISSQGADPKIVDFIVKNHMKVKPRTWDMMRQSKKDPIIDNPSYQDLIDFNTIDKGGLKELKQNNKMKLKNLLLSINEAIDIPDGKKAIIVLVGPPSVGKSTWIKSNFPDSYVINRDTIVEKVASSYGWTYDDMFATPPSDAQVGDVDEKYGTVEEAPSWMTWAKSVFNKVLEANGKVQTQMSARVKGAVPSGKNIVIDMTNMNAGARKNALKAIEGNEDKYHAVAVDFKFQGAEDTIKKMAAKRAEAAKRMGKSKTIPDAAFDRMFSSYEKPTTGEGFDDIISVDNIGVLKKALADNINENMKPSKEILRMKKLAGLITESEIKQTLKEGISVDDIADYAYDKAPSGAEFSYINGDDEDMMTDWLNTLIGKEIELENQDGEKYKAKFTEEDKDNYLEYLDNKS